MRPSVRTVATWLTASAAVVMLCAALPSLVVELSIVSSSYENLDEARAHGAIERGWILPFAPSSARDIAEVHDLDTNERCGRMTIGAADLPAFAVALRAAGFSPHRRVLPPLPDFSLWRACPFSRADASAGGEVYRLSVPNSAEFDYVALDPRGGVYFFNALE